MRTDSPLLIEGPKAETTDTSIIELQATHTTDETVEAPPAPAQVPRWYQASYVPIAAAIVFAVGFGAIAGAVTSSVMSNPSAPPEVAGTTQAIQASVAHLSSEIATIKVSIASAQRSTSSQFGKLAERLDRTEKAQAEPTAKLAKIQESIDRLDKRQVAAVAPASDITGSVAPKDESKPQVAEGWRLRDYYDGRAVVENRNGTLFKVQPGSKVPGLGKVETIKRENGRVVVVTASGIIAASLDQRRPTFYMPRW